MNELEIREYLQSDKYTTRCFQGVMAYNELSLVNPSSGLYIVNTDISSGPGIHWVCLFLGEENEYFDSLGNPPTPGLRYFLEIQGKTYKYSNRRIQGNSDVCGDYCILFAYFRSRGISMSHFVDMFTQNVAQNDILVRL